MGLILYFHAQSIDWAEPADGTEAAIVAAQRALDQYVGMVSLAAYRLMEQH